jgi:hypothetical protein
MGALAEVMHLSYSETDGIWLYDTYRTDDYEWVMRKDFMVEATVSFRYGF